MNAAVAQVSDTISYSRGVRITDVHPRAEAAPAFDAFRIALDRDRSADKKSAGYFCAEMGGDGRRCEENAQPRRWLPFDIDGVAPEAVPLLLEFFSPLSALGWESHSSSADAPRWRFIIELDRPVSRVEGIELGRILSERLSAHVGPSLKIDKAVFRPEQACFLAPAGRPITSFGSAKLAVDDLLCNGETLHDPAPYRRELKTVFCALLSSSVGGLASSVAGSSIPPRCLPTEPGERHSKLFEYARHVVATNPDASEDELHTLAASWHEQALPYIDTKSFTAMWADFRQAVGKVKYPYGANMNEALSLIDHNEPLGLEGLGYYEVDERLVRLCSALQRQQAQQHQADPTRGEAFFLSARMAGEYLGVHFTEAASMMKALCDDGILLLVKKGVGKLASRYLYVWNTKGDSDRPAAEPAEAAHEAA